MKRKVIIDCDPGIDDSLALIYAIQHPDLEVVALTIVAGNVPVDLGVENAFKILERLNRLDIPVYAGVDKPLVRDFMALKKVIDQVVGSKISEGQFDEFTLSFPTLIFKLALSPPLGSWPVRAPRAEKSSQVFYS